MATTRTPTSTPQRPGPVEIPPTLSVRELAELLGLPPVEVIKDLMKNGVMAALTQVIDYETAAIVATDFGFEPREMHPAVEEPVAPEAAGLKRLLEEEDPAKLKPRPPVVTVMGHVDHGKTSLLDAIRHANVAAQEAGGITQHIGAYQVETHGNRITFLDTPGHEAFTAMRARGARVTDIAVLVVAADDGVMPQTLEAIEHARAAEVPIVVALNKIDKPNANPDRVLGQLAEHGLVPVQYGGDTEVVPVSARTKQGIPELLDTIIAVAELAELKANPNRPAVGTVIEAKLDKARGPVATVLVQNGTLKVGDIVVAGSVTGRVRALFNDRGKRIKQAGPSVPVEVLGLSSVPEAGDRVTVVPDERTAQALAAQQKREREREQAGPAQVSLEDVFRKMQEGEVRELALVVKADVHGSVEPVVNSLEGLTEEGLRVKVIRTGVGNITESDVMLAAASKAIVIGFNVKAEAGAQRLAEQEGVDIRSYSVIYNLVDDIRKALQGLLAPKYAEVVHGHAEVRAVFKVGRNEAAGCYVTDGTIARNHQVRVLRGGGAVFEGKIASLRRVKEDVREVAAGYECGVMLEGFTGFQVGDRLETFTLERA